MDEAEKAAKAREEKYRVVALDTERAETNRDHRRSTVDNVTPTG